LGGGGGKKKGRGGGKGKPFCPSFREEERGKKKKTDFLAIHGGGTEGENVKEPSMKLAWRKKGKEGKGTGILVSYDGWEGRLKKGKSPVLRQGRIRKKGKGKGGGNRRRRMGKKVGEKEKDSQKGPHVCPPEKKKGRVKPAQFLVEGG